MRKTLAAAIAVAVVGTGFTAAPASAKTTWLCKPGQRNDPCTPSLATTIFSLLIYLTVDLLYLAVDPRIRY